MKSKQTNRKSQANKYLAMLFILIAIVIIVLSVRSIRNYLSQKKVNDFQAVMLDFKKMNANQADGDIVVYGDSLIQGMSPYGLNFKYVNMGAEDTLYIRS